MCLAQGPQHSDAGEARTVALRSRVKHSTTEPLRSPTYISVDLAHNEIFHAKVSKCGIKLMTNVQNFYHFFLRGQPL